MKTQYIIGIPKTTEKLIVATAELFGQTFKSYEKLEEAVESYGIEKVMSYHVDTFIDDLNTNKVDLESNNFVPVIVKEGNEYRR